MTQLVIDIPSSLATLANLLPARALATDPQGAYDFFVGCVWFIGLGVAFCCLALAIDKIRQKRAAVH